MKAPTITEKKKKGIRRESSSSSAEGGGGGRTTRERQMEEKTHGWTQSLIEILGKVFPQIRGNECRVGELEVRELVGVDEAG